MRPGGEISYVAVGANLGDREATFAAVLRALESESELLLLSVSSIFETEAVGPEGQPAYLNAAVCLRTWLSPSALLTKLQAIERALGRDRSRESVRFGPREVDLDILFFGERCIEMPDLVVPHPRAHERAFVMTPLAELAPDLVHPRLGRSIREIAREREDREAVRPWPRPAGWPGALR
jgi:2-amino-4-hydroxy-6-hydroxymethyldihydropteridine diphosphokinase